MLLRGRARGYSGVSMSNLVRSNIYHGLPQLVGSMCAISGVLVMSLPIPIIAGNFEKFHKTQAKKNKLLKRRAATAAAKVREEKVKDSVRWHYYHLLCIDFMGGKIGS